MTLFFLGLVIGALLGYLFAKPKPTAATLPYSGSSVPSRQSNPPDFDPVSNFMSEIETGVQLLAENQRNRNMREALRIKAEREQIASAYHSRLPS